MAEAIEVKVYKNIDGFPSSAAWSNTYHIEVDGVSNNQPNNETGMFDAGFAERITKIMNFERGLHITNVRILRAVCTTVSDSDKGLPQSVRVVPYGQLGNRAGIVDDKPVPLEVVLKVSFAGLGGRAGANQYRGALWASEVEAEQSGYRLKAAASVSLNNVIDNGLTLGQLYGKFFIVKKKAGVIISRPVISITLAGIGLRQRTQHRKSGKFTTPNSAKQAIKESGGILSDVRNYLEKLILDTDDRVAAATIIGVYNALLNRLRPLELEPVPQLPQ